MGVPAFYRWLSEKYPKIVQDVLEERVALHPNSTTAAPFDASRRPNPSGLECDHLYIDMNGIIHPCSHPEVGPQPKTEEDMFDNVCRYVDRLVRVVRPRALLMLAIDGVAPRAKMNQQRARRFRSAQEAREHAELEEQIREDLQAQGKPMPPKSTPWDSNVITPGTEFMLHLSDFLRFYIRKRMATDPAWQSIRVIFSDASVPGEGEHKIMKHIRHQRCQPGYTPNLVHVLHGLDADLIMLALATHEAHFYILREQVLFGRKSQEQMEARQQQSGFAMQQQALDDAVGSVAMQQLSENQHKPLERISIPILREYLSYEFAGTLQTLPFPASLERLLDDLVFLCFFVGNDFIPHLPSLDIRDGALDFLFNVYKRILPGLGDYITNHGGQVNLRHVDVILAEVGAIEDLVFAMRYDQEQRMKAQDEQRKRGNQRHRPPPPPPPPVPPKLLGKAARILEQQREDIALQRDHQAKEKRRLDIKQIKAPPKPKVTATSSEANAMAALALRESLSTTAPAVEEDEEDVDMKVVKKEEDTNGDDTTTTSSTSPRKRAADEIANGEEELDVKVKIKSEPIDDDEMIGDDEVEGEEEDAVEEEEELEIPPIKIEAADPETARLFKEKVKAVKQKQLDDYSQNVVDNVRLHEKGWKDRYYTDKCKADDVEKHGGREHMFRTYVMGLCWVMKYYYDGCPSWKFYYPFHYAPFASDLKNIERFEKDCRSFELHVPFNPVEQLMAVLPPDSAKAIPKAARWLMSDPESPIIDFYPVDVPVDPNGKAMPWLWVVLLPFIDEDRLLAALGPTMADWTKTELLCNARGLDDGYLFIHMSHPFARKLAGVLQGGKTAQAPKVRLTDSASYGCPGFTGSVRPPLSNELYPTDEEIIIPPPARASNIDRANSENLFFEPIEPNAAVCVAFTEPLRLPHKSILIPGAVPPPPCLTQDDTRLRRPRLSRGGASIAHLGMTPTSGNTERDFSARPEKGYERNQGWGSLEPAPKRVREAAPPYHPNPFMAHPQALPSQRYAQQNFDRPPWQNQGGARGYDPGHQQPNQHFQRQSPNPQAGWSSLQQAANQHRGQNQGQHVANNYRGQPNAHGVNNNSYQRQQNGFQGDRNQQFHGQYPPPQHQQARAYQHQQVPAPGMQGQQQAQGYNFRALVNDRGQQSGGRSNSQPDNTSRADTNVMSSLRAQLASTLKQQNNRRPGAGSDQR